MSDSTPTITAILFGIVYLGLILGIWYWRFRKTSSRIANTTQSNPTSASVYRARYGSDALMGELYLSKDRVYFEKAGAIVFEAAPQDVRTVVYNKRSLQFVLRSGQSYILRYLHPSAEKQGALGYWAFYSVMYNDPDTLKTLVNDLHSLNVEVKEGSTGQESPYFYFAIACAVFSFSFIAIMAIAKFILGMDSFLGINL